MNNGNYNGRGLSGEPDKSADPRPKRISRQKAIAELAYFRYIQRQQDGVPGTAQDDWQHAVKEYLNFSE